MRTNKAPSILAHDIVVTGSITTDGEVQIDGRLEGDIRAGALTIGPGAFVKGDIVAGSVVVHGRIEGRVQARSVVLASPSSVQGEISYATLSIQSGAVMDGLCRRVLDASAPDKPGQAPASPAGHTRTEPEMPAIRPVLLGLTTRPKDTPGNTA